MKRGTNQKIYKMPMRLPNDPHVVTFLNDEAERMAREGNKWKKARTPNPIAAETCMKTAWAHLVSANWLRAKLNGDFDQGHKPNGQVKRKRGRPRKDRVSQT